MPIRRPAHACHGYSSYRNSVLWAFSSLVVQFDQAACLTRLQATSTRGVRDHIRCVDGCATSTGFAGHAGATEPADLDSAGRLRASMGACRSRTNADDRLPRASLGCVEGGDGIVEGRDVPDVRPQSSVTHPLDDLT